MEFKLEICVDSLQSAITAQLAGAHRIELCENLPEGGCTPGPGKILSVRSNLDIAVNVIIRPRGSDFLYTDDEFDIMRRDIEFCGEAGIDGVVIGILRSDGNIDIERTARLVELAAPMSVTFHRAFDLCSDPFRALEDIISTGSARLLTSGQKNKAHEGVDLISTLVNLAGERIIIMPGSGIDTSNIEAIARKSHAKEFHMTGRKTTISEMEFRRDGVLMGSDGGQGEYSRKIADEIAIRKTIEILKMI